MIIGSIPVGIVGLLFQETDRRTIHEEPLGNRHDDDRRRSAVDRRRVSWEARSWNDATRNQGCTRGWMCPGARPHSGFESLWFDDHGWTVCGQTRETAARFSFLLSIPAIAASGLLELKEAIEKLPPEVMERLSSRQSFPGLSGMRRFGSCCDSCARTRRACSSFTG